MYLVQVWQMWLTAIPETVHTYAIGENKVDIMHVYVYEGLNYDVKIVR